jgi:ABC-type bacteriocin/lantibiotic exporter with double-glycine peptidase domain
MLTLFVLLRFALNNLPSTLFAIIESSVALQRIESFLETPDHASPNSSPAMREAIKMTNVVRGWAPHKPAITVPSLSIERGELVVVIGGVGAGKSALLLSILGELSGILPSNSMDNQRLHPGKHHARSSSRPREIPRSPSREWSAARPYTASARR